MTENNLNNRFIPVPNMIDQELPDSSLIRAETLRDVLKYMYNNMEGGGGGGSPEVLISLIKQIFGGEIVPEVSNEIGSPSILEHLKNGIKPKYIELPQGLSIDNYITGVQTANNNTLEIGNNEILIVKEYYKTDININNYNAQRTYVVIKSVGKYGKPVGEGIEAILKEDFKLISDGLILQSSSETVKTVMDVKPDPRGNIKLDKKVLLWETANTVDDKSKFTKLAVIDLVTGGTFFIGRDEIGKLDGIILDGVAQTIKDKFIELDLKDYLTKINASNIYVSKNGVETIYKTKTFDESPIVPKGTLGNHTVNKNQLDLKVDKNESNEILSNFDFHQKDGAYINVDVDGLKVSKGGIYSLYKPESIKPVNQVPSAAYQFQELLFPKRTATGTEEKVYPITYINGVKANENGKADIWGVANNWTNASQRFSSLVSKHNDATFNRLLGMDVSGNINEVGLPALTNEMSKSTDAQKDAWRIANRKSTETYSIGQPRVDTILPPVIDNTKDYIQYTTLVGLNLFLNNSSPSTALVKIIRYKDIDNNLVPETIVDITNYQVYQTNTSILSFGIRYDSLLTGYYKVQVTHNGLINIGSSDILVTTQVTNNPIILDSWETYTPFEPNNLIVTNTSLKKTYGGVIRGSTVIEQQVKHFIIKKEDVLSGFRLNFVYKLTPAGTELGNVMVRSSITFGLGYDQNINNTVVPDILISFIRGVLSLGLTSSIQPLTSLPLIYEIGLVVKNSLATVIVTLKNTGKVTTETFSFEQRNQQMYFYSTFLGSNADNPVQISGSTQELLFQSTYQSF